MGMTKLTSPVLAAVLAATLSPAALADPPASKPGMKIAYADLDTTTVHGATTLLGRINDAALELCGPLSHSPLAPRAGGQFRACVDEAVDAAVARLHAPLVAALHRGEPVTAAATLASR